eukprot:gene6488-8759_t
MSIGSTLSTVGFGLCGLVFCALSAILQHILNPCNVRNFPDFEGKISEEECVAWLRAPDSGGELAADFIALVTVIIRIEACLILAFGVGAVYQLTLPYTARKGAAFVYGVASLCALLVDLSAVKAIEFGANALMTEAIAASSTPLIFIWAIMGSCFWLSWFLTPSSLDEDKKKN